jgi:hypothetical protein
MEQDPRWAESKGPAGLDKRPLSQRKNLTADQTGDPHPPGQSQHQDKEKNRWAEHGCKGKK